MDFVTAFGAGFLVASAVWGIGWIAAYGMGIFRDLSGIEK